MTALLSLKGNIFISETSDLQFSLFSSYIDHIILLIEPLAKMYKFDLYPMLLIDSTDLLHFMK